MEGVTGGSKEKKRFFRTKIVFVLANLIEIHIVSGFYISLSRSFR